MRYAARKDANEAAIVKAMRDRGAYVWHIGIPVDLLIGYRGWTLLVECKDGEKKKLTSLQRDFFSDWRGGTLCRIDSVDAALAVLREIDAKQEQAKIDES